ncbi:CNNM domain-containing protein [Ornithinimicrobium flavum]|uniref:CNNM domain-containing protein n=1 Tax=Ornithinimicrobium flavum TaxID=1288636 RepID=UPI001EE869EF|nr:CNNM domain-containing protein [Ornithinimicrobium flavum]
MSIGTAMLVSLVLLVANAFFVAAEFAIVAAKRHRLEERAAEGSRAAQAAVDASRQLSLMLAGAQLGITLCTLGLGAIAKPAMKDLVYPLLTALNVPAPDVVLSGIAVAVAVGTVVFLHMVVGEMAPKSWAISHPESSAMLLALPFRAFTWVMKPVLWLMNELANLMLRAGGWTRSTPWAAPTRLPTCSCCWPSPTSTASSRTPTTGSSRGRCGWRRRPWRR